MAGYRSQAYASSFLEVGVPKHLAWCDGWIIERKIPDASDVDAMGCYPVFCCKDWKLLERDLEELTRIVTLTVVTDPFGYYDESLLRRCFPDLAAPFKEHFIIDLSRSPKEFIDSHHLRYARKALQEVDVEECREPLTIKPDWLQLYANLIQRHGIAGMTKFSVRSFEQQLQTPGLRVIRAAHSGSTVGINLWYESDGVGYYHLGAYSDAGYKMRASFALFAFAIERFAAMGIKWLSLGAGAGSASNNTDGLTRFKRGWSTGTRMVYLCGRTFDRGKYSQLQRKTNTWGTTYFPAYRSGEFS